MMSKLNIQSSKCNDSTEMSSGNLSKDIKKEIQSNNDNQTDQTTGIHQYQSTTFCNDIFDKNKCFDQLNETISYDYNVDNFSFRNPDNTFNERNIFTE